MSFVKTCLLGLVLVIAGCSSDNQRVSFAKAVPIKLPKLFAKKQPPVDVLASITPQMLAKVSTPVIFAKIEKTGGQAILYLVGDNRGAKTYLSGDKISLTLKGGVVVASRGLAGDLMSSDAGGVDRSLAHNRTPAPYSRQYYWVDGEDHTQSLTLTCTQHAIAPETITIVGATRSTRHIREQCAQGVTNDYWVGRGAHKVWQSRQWLGAKIGYISVTNLVP